MTPTQRELARHALGLGRGVPTAYRNSFVTGPTSNDHKEWMQMVEAGEATRRDGSSLPFGGDDLFRLTRKGADAALNRGESLGNGLIPQ